jgi:addiction module RelB/DinJ family antitoxin
MNTVISVKIDKKTKEAAQEVAKSMGLTLSSLINAQLRQAIVTRRVEFYAPEQMTKKTEKLIEEAEKEIAAGNVVGPFDNVEDFLSALHKKPK